MVRIGIVMAVNRAERTVRVKFPDMEADSGWLHMLKQSFFLTPEIGDRAVVAEVEDGDNDEMVVLGVVM